MAKTIDFNPLRLLNFTSKKYGKPVDRGMATFGGVMRHRIRKSRLIIWPLAAAIFLVSSRWDDHVVIKGALFLVGCLLVGLATIGRLWCSQYICAHKTKNLVTSGPYSVCRNPLYLFSVIGALGVGFATETLTIPLVLAVMFAVFYPTVILAEEAKLAPLHGDAFKAYMARVPRFWPRFKGMEEPAEYTVFPAKFRHALFDALWFIWFVGIIHLAGTLRAAGILPTLVKLY